MINKKWAIIAWPRSTKQLVLIAFDVLCLLFSVWAAYSLRLGQALQPNHIQWLLIAAAPVIAVPVFIANGLYRSVIRYVGEKALWSVVKCTTQATLLWSALVFFMDVQRLEAAPRSVPLFYWLILSALIIASRFGARWLLWLPTRRQISDRQVLIYGANEAAVQLANSLMQGRELFPAGFIDDSPELVHKDIAGIRVYPSARIPFLIDHYEIRDAIVCLPGGSHALKRQAVQSLEDLGLKVRILPALADIASGKNLVNLVREVDVGDLLGRDPVAADPALLGRCIRNKVVLVTGAGGSIGSELCRQIAALSPSCLVILDHSEPALYQVHRKIDAMGVCTVVPILGSVTNPTLVNSVFAQHSIQTVYHAAAHKHVPLVESNVAEGVYNNIHGTRCVAQAARQHGVETFVLISTDKAVRPTNVMGATKRWAELAVQQQQDMARAAGQTQPRFCAVRFGNVLGSSGSVIPLFREQIAQGGPVTVTHPDINRFFMSIHEAVELVIQAGSLADGGEVFLLDMGESVKILDLARNMIKLAGLEPVDPTTGEGDIAIAFTGLRPGEKLYEELLIDHANARQTAHPKILSAYEPLFDVQAFDQVLTELNTALQRQQVDQARQLLLKVACS
ncbi:MAG TPA: nucleoside-diphosphate sugar epimerase/dehydratase [Limnobacter sp.]|uniref:polysaccharide biosynthesis protein n=1 Tax=Limnobacter sp. TaxID=2003368 RepID=UPI002EDBA715